MNLRGLPWKLRSRLATVTMVPIIAVPLDHFLFGWRCGHYSDAYLDGRSLVDFDFGYGCLRPPPF